MFKKNAGNWQLESIPFITTAGYQLKICPLTGVMIAVIDIYRLLLNTQLEVGHSHVKKS